MRSALLLALGLLASLALAQTPIPSKIEGYPYGNPHAKVALDVYYDLLCADTKAFNPEFKDFLATKYDDKTYAEHLFIRLHIFPLPYHTNAFIASKLVPELDRRFGAAGVYNYTDWMLENQDRYLSPARDLSENEVVAKLCKEVGDASVPLTESQCKSVFLTRSTEMDTRISWKFACANGISGTPQVMIDGVNMGEPPMTAKAWTDYMSSFLDKTYSMHARVY